MSDDAEFDRLDDTLAELHERLETCRRGMLLARAALIAGAALLTSLTVFGAPFDGPAVFIAGLVAIFGGIVWLGASRTSRDEARSAIAEAEGRKNELIDAVAARRGWRDVTDTVH